MSMATEIISNENTKIESIIEAFFVTANILPDRHHHQLIPLNALQLALLAFTKNNRYVLVSRIIGIG